MRMWKDGGNWREEMMAPCVVRGPFLFLLLLFYTLYICYLLAL